MAMILNNWKEKFSEIVSPLIGSQLIIENIHSCNPGSCYYIRELTPGCPIILIRYDGSILAILPEEDFSTLEKGNTSAEDYIQNSHFYFGYYLGGCDITSIYWMPLEATHGIHDSDKIKNYLTIMKCYTLNVSKGYSLIEDNCNSCDVESGTCPFSPLNTNNTLKNQFQKHDARLGFIDEIKKTLIKKNPGATISIFSHTDWINSNVIKLYKFNDNLHVQVPQRILNDMMYHPNNCWSNILKELTFSEILS